MALNETEFAAVCPAGHKTYKRIVSYSSDMRVICGAPKYGANRPGFPPYGPPCEAIVRDLTPLPPAQ